MKKLGRDKNTSLFIQTICAEGKRFLTLKTAGYILTIEQAIGTCEGSRVKTEMYKISHTNPDGTLFSSKIVNSHQLNDLKTFHI
jgi:hypothetical protein